MALISMCTKGVYRNPRKSCCYEWISDLIWSKGEKPFANKAHVGFLLVMANFTT